ARSETAIHGESAVRAVSTLELRLGGADGRAIGQGASSSRCVRLRDELEQFRIGVHHIIVNDSAVRRSRLAIERVAEFVQRVVPELFVRRNPSGDVTQRPRVESIPSLTPDAPLTDQASLS